MDNETERAVRRFGCAQCGRWYATVRDLFLHQWVEHLHQDVVLEATASTVLLQDTVPYQHPMVRGGN